MYVTVYGYMHLKDLLWLIDKSRGEPATDFYLVLHGQSCRKSTVIEQTNKQTKFEWNPCSGFGEVKNVKRFTYDDDGESDHYILATRFVTVPFIGYL